MARVFIDGFEGGDFMSQYTATPYSSGAVAVYSATQAGTAWKSGETFSAPARGSYVAFMRYPGSYLDLDIYPDFVGILNILHVKFRYQTSTSGTTGSDALLKFINGSGLTMTTVGLVNNYLAIWKGEVSTPTLVELSSSLIPKNTWACIEVAVAINSYGSGTGTYKVYRDGTQVLGGTADINGASSGIPSIQTLQFGLSGTGSTDTAAIDDIVVDDTNSTASMVIGTSYVSALYPNANSVNAWGLSNSAQAVYLHVNEAPADDTDYLYTSGVNVEFDLGLDNPLSTINPVKNLQAQYRVIKYGSPSCSSVEPFLRNTTGYGMSGVNKTVPSSMKTVCHIWPSRPTAMGGGSWYSTNMGAVRIGLKSKG